MRQIYTHYRRAFAGTLPGSGARTKTLFLCLMLLALATKGIAQTTLGGVNLGNLPQHLFVFMDPNNDDNLLIINTLVNICPVIYTFCLKY